jgi:hypothetical protein
MRGTVFWTAVANVEFIAENGGGSGQRFKKARLTAT